MGIKTPTRCDRQEVRQNPDMVYARLTAHAPPQAFLRIPPLCAATLSGLLKAPPQLCLASRKLCWYTAPGGVGGGMSVSNIIITHHVFSSALIFKAQSSLAHIRLKGTTTLLTLLLPKCCFFLPVMDSARTGRRYFLFRTRRKMQICKSFRFDF